MSPSCCCAEPLLDPDTGWTIHNDEDCPLYFKATREGEEPKHWPWWDGERPVLPPKISDDPVLMAKVVEIFRNAELLEEEEP